MVNPRRTSSVGREIPLRAAGIRRRRASRSVLRLPTARQLFADENDLTSRVTRYSPVRSFAPSRAYPYRPPRNPPAVLQEEQQPRARPPSPNYSPIQDSSNPSYSPVRTPEDLPSIPEERRPIEQSTETEAGPSNPGQVLDPPEPNFYPEPEDLVLPSSIQPLAGLTDEKEIKEDQIEATMAAPTTVLNKTKRESELESEITLLRKEYNRVIKERAEYENAIQRALLRGVSSLNVEALRVLRCPPIPCCIPCAPCPATAGIIPPEPVVPCPAKSAKRRSGSTTATMNNATVPRDSDQINCRTKRPCNSPCCFVDRSRKSADGSMIFLLRQDNERNLRDEDAIPICGSTIVKKIELPPLRRFET